MKAAAIGCRFLMGVVDLKVLMSHKGTLAVTLFCLAIAGCGVKTRENPGTVPAAAPLSGAQQSQEKARVMQAIQGMTPEQRAAYFKANPGDAAALAP